MMLSRSDRARARAEQALALAREVGNPDCLQWSLYSLGRALATSDDRLAAAAFDEAIAVTRPADSRWGRCINMIEWIGAERRLGAFDAAAAGLLELLQLLTANGHRSLLSQALREVAYVLHTGGDDETAAVALLAREGLPDMPVLGGTRDEPLEAVLRDAAGDGWDRLRLRARSLPEADLVRLCRGHWRRALPLSGALLGGGFLGGGFVGTAPCQVRQPEEGGIPVRVGWRWGADHVEVEVREHERRTVGFQERKDRVPADVSRSQPQQGRADAVWRVEGRPLVGTPATSRHPVPAVVDDATPDEAKSRPDNVGRERASRRAAAGDDAGAWPRSARRGAPA